MQHNPDVQNYAYKGLFTEKDKLLARVLVSWCTFKSVASVGWT